MQISEKEALCEALGKDLHKDPTEAYYMEINLVDHEIQHMLDHLEEWSSPEAVSTDILNIPGVSEIRRDPLGVVLIIGAWNYPIQLTLCPLAGALAAGNAAVIKVPSEHYSRHCSEAMHSLLPKYMDPKVVRVMFGDRHMTQAWSMGIKTEPG